MILKGISPGAALVFLLAGPATNITSLTVLYGILGKKTTAIYLSAIAVMAVVAGLVLDHVYASLGISAQAVAGQAAELIPRWAQIAGALVLLALSVKPVYRAVRPRLPIGNARVRTKTCCCSSESCRNEGDIICEPSVLAQGSRHP